MAGLLAIELQIAAKTTIIKSRFNGLDVSNYNQKKLNCSYCVLVCQYVC